MNVGSTKVLRTLSMTTVILLAFSMVGASQGMIPDMFSAEVPQAESPSQISEEGVGYTGIMQMEHQRDTDGDGEYETVKTYLDENKITDQGLNFFECKVSGVSCSLSPTVANSDYAQYIAVAEDDDSESSISNTATSLPNEITTGNLSRSQGTVVDEGTGYYSVEYTFTATSDFNSEPGIDHTGLHWTGTSSETDLVAHNTFPAVTMLADDKLTVDWTEVSFNRP